MKTKILSILALLLMTVTQGAWAQETLTVFDETGTSQHIPMHGYDFDSYTKSECIIPASVLTAMEGGTITAITFYVKEVDGMNSTFSPANQKVFLKEVSETTLSSYSGMDDATVVFDGTLPMPTTGGYTISFSQGYTYNGGNLLIGVYNVATGLYNVVTWYGNNNQSDRVSAYGYNYSSLDNVGFTKQNFLPKTTFTYTPAPTAVDLGLPSGTKWADMNVGAGSATGIGTYFEWGETTAYDNNNSYSGNNPTTLPLSNDAAYANWGSNWRMPTKAEYDELLNATYTTWTWYENYNSTGVGGYLVTSNTNGNSIFLPKTGYMKDGSLNAQDRCDYWSSTINGSNNNNAYALGVGSGDRGTSNFSRSFGFAIRPVQMFAGEGTQDSPYLIASTTDWNNLVSAVNGGEAYSGTYFKMTANVDASTMIGSSTETFNGNFDGDGHTLNLSINSSSMIAAPFAYVVGGTIKNVNLTGTVSTTSMHPSSLVGYADNCTIRNCTSSVAISTSRNNDIDGGAFVACVIANKTVTIEGCAFTGSITFSDAAGYEGGGFVGWMRTPSTVTLTDCLFAPSAVSLAKASPAFKMFAYDNAGTTLTLNNCYYNGTAACNEKITKQDGTMQMHTIAAGDYVSTLSVTKGDATATYDVSGITVYSTGIDFNDGSTTTFYGGSGQTVNLALTAETRDGYHFKQYAASQGTLSGQTTNTPTLTMPAANSTANDAVTISAEYDPTYNATFASGNDNDGWTISPTQQIEGGTVTVSYTGENKVKSVTVAPKGALTGKFSVSSTSQVQFSKGNLQYVGSWQFAANQYDIFGESQSDDQRDLFGWGTKTNPNNTSTTNGDYSWAEWGENTITNGCTGWRTLTKDEWGYLFTNRTNASTLRTFATVNSVTGLIVMPDGWTASGVTLTITTANYTTNVLSTSQWATLEKQGCVFLPAAGGRNGTTVVNVGSIGDYWSSDASGETNAYDLNFSINHLIPQNDVGQRHYGWSVRLVRDVAVKANPSTLAGLKAAINDASDLTDLNTKVLGKYVTATGDIQSTSEGAVGIIAYISKTAVDNSFADSRIFVLATENASNSAAQAPSNSAETTYNSTSDLNGYAVTNVWQALDGYNASKAGWNYSASRPDGASHWFVPSYGQWMLGGWNDGNNRPCRLMRSTMQGSGQFYAVSTAINTEGNDTGYCVDGSWWGMGTIQRVQGILVRAAFVY